MNTPYSPFSESKQNQTNISGENSQTENPPFNSSVDFNQIKKAKDILEEIKTRSGNSIKKEIPKKIQTEKDTAPPFESQKDFLSNIQNNCRFDPFAPTETPSSGSVFSVKGFCKIILFLISLMILANIFYDFEENKVRIWSTIPPHHKGIVYNAWNGRVTEVVDANTIFIFPWQEVYTMNLQPLSKTLKDIPVYSKGYTKVNFDVHISFTFESEKIQNIFEKTGHVDENKIWISIIEPRVPSITRDIIKQYPVQKIIDKQNNIETAIEKKLEEYVKLLHIDIIKVNLSKIDLLPRKKS